MSARAVLLVGVAALAMCATAHAREYQCGPHYAETSGYFQVIASLFHNRTRANYKEGTTKIEEFVVAAAQSEIDEGARVSKILRRNRQGVMYYRGKACTEYKEE
jgi:hypothetical protein